MIPEVARSRASMPHDRRRAVAKGMQDSDPLGAAASRPLAVIASAASLLIAGVLTAFYSPEETNSLLMVTAFLLLAASCFLLVRGSSAIRTPFSTADHLAVVFLVCGAAATSALAESGNNPVARDDWGPYVIAIVLLATSPYRPLGSLVVALISSAVFAGMLGAVQTSLRVTDTSPFSFALLAAGPVVLIAGAGIAYVRADIMARASSDRTTLVASEPVRPSEHEERFVILTREVAPLFSAVIGRGTVELTDIARGNEIAEDVRATMVRSANQSWIATAVRESVEAAQGHPVRSHGGVYRLAHVLANARVRDPMNLSLRMSVEQRVALRALLDVVLVHDQLLPEAFRVRVDRGTVNARVVIEAGFGAFFDGGSPKSSWRGALAGPRAREHSLRRLLTPFVAVARAVFSSVDVSTNSTGESVKVTLRFSYGL